MLNDILIQLFQYKFSFQSEEKEKEMRIGLREKFIQYFKSNFNRPTGQCKIYSNYSSIVLSRLITR